MKINKLLSSSVFVLIISGCNEQSGNPVNKDNSVVANVASQTQVENSKPVTAVSACKVLTLADVVSVYPNSKFSVENDRNDPPNIYEALSACGYKEDGKQLIDQYFVDLEVRAKPTAKEALKFLSDRKEMDYDKKGKTISGYGDDAYYTNVSMVSGGPKLEFVKDNVYYNLGIRTIKRGAVDTLESELMALGKKVLE